MPNHIHALIRTPQSNLARGMQHWLSGYANWYAKRNRRTGHLYQERYNAFPVEDEGCYWNLRVLTENGPTGKPRVVLLLLFPQDMLRLVKLVLGVLQFLFKSFVGRSEFDVFCGQFFSSSSLRVPTAKEMTRRCVPSSLVFSD